MSQHPGTSEYASLGTSSRRPPTSPDTVAALVIWRSFAGRENLASFVFVLCGTAFGIESVLGLM